MQNLASIIIGVVVGVILAFVFWVWRRKIYPRRRRIWSSFKSIFHRKPTPIDERYTKPEKGGKKERTIEEEIDDDDLWTPHS